MLRKEIKRLSRIKGFKENMEHHRDVERLWAEINRLMIYTKKLNDSELKSTA